MRTERFFNMIRVLIGFLAGYSVCTGTSIVFPAFNAPIVTEDAIFAHHTYGKSLICIDRKCDTVRWRFKAPTPIERAWIVSNRTIAIVSANKVSILDSSRGSILKSWFITGHVFGGMRNGNILSETRNDEVVCTELNTGMQLWKHECQEPHSNLWPVLADDLIFIGLDPRSIMTRFDGRTRQITMKGTNAVVCLSAKLGMPLWNESVPLSNHGLGVHLQVSKGLDRLLCMTDNSLRLVDRKSGRIVSRWDHKDDDIDGADFWGDGRMAVCFGGIGATKRTIRMLGAADFKTKAEFTARALEVASVKVVGDVMILDSLYRSIGVDLRSQKTIWEKGQRHYTIKDGLLYFGENQNGKRVLGVCDPKNGRDTEIYSEPVME